MIFGKLVPSVLLATGVLSAGLIKSPIPEQAPAEIPAIVASSSEPSVIDSITEKPQILPVVPGQTWDNLVDTPQARFDVDPSSIVITPQHDGWEVTTKLRMTFFNDIAVEGKAEKGWFYVNTMTAVCSTGDLRIDQSSVFTKEGKLITTGHKLGTMKNPRNAKSFVTLWVYVLCNDLKDKKPPTRA